MTQPPTSPATPTQQQSSGPRRLGDILVEAGLVSQEQLKQALDYQRNQVGRKRLGEVIVELGFASESAIAKCLASLLGLPMVDLNQFHPPIEVVRILPRAVAERTGTLLLESTDTHVVAAVADPTNVLAIDDVKMHLSGRPIQIVVATNRQVMDAIHKAWSLDQNQEDIDKLGPAEEDEPGIISGKIEVANEEGPIVKLVSQILSDAVRMNASDIHIESQASHLLVRYRVDGILRDIIEAPARIASAVVSRIKVVSGLDIAERRIPQDGRTRIQVGTSNIDTRVSTLPSLHGEKVVIRLLTRGDDVPPLRGLGFDDRQFSDFTKSLSVPQGLVLITGPTGSGKTNTLYSAIAHILDPEKNIVTLEDPVEVQLPGITQVQVNAKSGMTFAAGLRSILRQDPDIVLVGEVRDTETAELAIKASMTGHLVLTTLHTNSAVAAITRLVDMGVEPFNVASSLTCAIAQRLVRRVHAVCAEPYTPSDEVLELLSLSREDIAGTTPMKGKGCAECGGSGYKGRTAVYEVLVVDADMRDTLLQGASESALQAQARMTGMLSLRGSALTKARLGLSTFEEALRVTQAAAGEDSACKGCSKPLLDDMIACPWCSTERVVSRCAACNHDLDPTWGLCPWCKTTRTPLKAPARVASIDALPPNIPEPAAYVPTQAAPAGASTPAPSAGAAPPVGASAPAPSPSASGNGAAPQLPAEPTKAQIPMVGQGDVHSYGAHQPVTLRSPVVPPAPAQQSADRSAPLPAASNEPENPMQGWNF